MLNVLLLDPNVTRRAYLKCVLFQEALSFVECESYSHFETTLSAHSFDLIILDEEWVQFHPNTLPFIQSQGITAPLFFTLSEHHLADFQGSVLLYAKDYVLKPLNASDCIFRVRKCLNTSQPKVACWVQSSDETSLNALEKAGFSVHKVSPKAPLEALLTNLPSAILIAQHFLEDSKIMKAFKEGAFSAIPVVVITSNPVFSDWSPNDYVLSPAHPQDVVLRLKKVLGNATIQSASAKAEAHCDVSVNAKEALQQEKEKFLQQIKVALHHEIRNPLTSILIGSQALHNQFPEGSPQKEVVHGIEKCSKRIKAVMDSLGNMKQFVVDDYVHGVQMINLSKSSS